MKRALFTCMVASTLLAAIAQAKPPKFVSGNTEGWRHPKSQRGIGKWKSPKLTQPHVPAAAEVRKRPMQRGPSTKIEVRPLTSSAVLVTSSRDISNVELRYYDGSRQRFEGLSGRRLTFTGTGRQKGKRITTVWVKSGPNFSGDGPGLGERFDVSAVTTKPRSTSLR